MQDDTGKPSPAKSATALSNRILRALRIAKAGQATAAKAKISCRRRQLVEPRCPHETGRRNLRRVRAACGRRCGGRARKGRRGQRRARRVRRVDVVGARKARGCTHSGRAIHRRRRGRHLAQNKGRRRKLRAVGIRRSRRGRGRAGERWRGEPDLGIKRRLKPRDLPDRMGVTERGPPRKTSIKLGFAHKVCGARGALGGFRHRGEGLRASNALRARQIDKGTLARKRDHGRGIARPVIALAHIERVIDLVMGNLARSQSRWGPGIAGKAALELDRIGHQKKPPLIGVLVGRTVIPGRP